MPETWKVCQDELKRSLDGIEIEASQLGYPEDARIVKEFREKKEQSLADALEQRQQLYPFLKLCQDLCTNPEDLCQEKLTRAKSIVQAIEKKNDSNMEMFKEFTDYFDAGRHNYASAEFHKCCRKASCVSATGGCGLAGIAACLSGLQPSSLVQIPILGKCLAKAKMTKGGWFSGTSVAYAMTHAGPCYLGLSGSCGLCCCAACSFVGLRSHKLLCGRERMLRISEKCYLSSEFHRNMWRGLKCVIRDSRDHIEDLEQQPVRNISWKRDIKLLGEQIFHRLDAIDIYIIVNEKCGLVPVNFNVEVLLGTDRYNAMHNRLAPPANPPKLRHSFFSMSIPWRRTKSIEYESRCMITDVQSQPIGNARTANLPPFTPDVLDEDSAMEVVPAVSAAEAENVQSQTNRNTESENLPPFDPEILDEVSTMEVAVSTVEAENSQPQPYGNAEKVNLPPCNPEFLDEVSLMDIAPAVSAAEAENVQSQPYGNAKIEHVPPFDLEILGPDRDTISCCDSMGSYYILEKNRCVSPSNASVCSQSTTSTTCFLPDTLVRVRRADSDSEDVVKVSKLQKGSQVVAYRKCRDEAFVKVATAPQSTTTTHLVKCQAGGETLSVTPDHRIPIYKPTADGSHVVGDVQASALQVGNLVLVDGNIHPVEHVELIDCEEEKEVWKIGFYPDLPVAVVSMHGTVSCKGSKKQLRRSKKNREEKTEPVIQDDEVNIPGTGSGEYAD